MSIFISIIYAPFIFISLQYFDISIVSVAIFVISVIWFFIELKHGKKNAIYPSLYIILSISTFFLEEFLVLKILPSIVAILITMIMLISYLKKESIILHFAQKFTKKELPEIEKQYIHNSTLFWIFICCINILIHYLAFLDPNLDFWIYYSSVGGYLLLVFAGIIQYLHKKYVFDKRTLKVEV